MTYHKLVRDKIPEIILAKGETPITHIADDAEYWTKLKEKLQEEVAEFLMDTNIEEELTDVLEVIDAICAFKGISWATLMGIQQKKRDERGSFTKRIILDETTT